MKESSTHLRPAAVQERLAASSGGTPDDSFGSLWIAESKDRASPVPPPILIPAMSHTQLCETLAWNTFGTRRMSRDVEVFLDLNSQFMSKHAKSA